jgi:hypothetical protein
MSGRRCGAVLAAAALAAGLLGCSGFDRLEFYYESAPPDGAVVSFESISIHEGIAVGVEARPIDGDEVMDEETVVELDSRNPGILGVARSEPDDGDDDDDAEVGDWKFVIYGVSPGTTQVVVTIDDEIEAEIDATVEAQ